MKIKFRGLVLCAAAAVTLAGCGEDKPANVVATGEAANAAAKATSQSFRPVPGHWDVTMTMKEYDVGGMPEGIKEAFQKQIGQATTIDACLTPEEAARDDGKFFVPEKKGCDFQKFSMIDGQFSAEMVCTSGSEKLNVKTSGTYSAESYDMTVNTQGEMNGQPMKMVMHVAGKRDGECTGNEFQGISDETSEQVD